MWFWLYCPGFLPTVYTALKPPTLIYVHTEKRETPVHIIGYAMQSDVKPLLVCMHTCHRFQVFNTRIVAVWLVFGCQDGLFRLRSLYGLCFCSRKGSAELFSLRWLLYLANIGHQHHLMIRFTKSMKSKHIWMRHVWGWWDCSLSGYLIECST